MKWKKRSPAPRYGPNKSKLGHSTQIPCIVSMERAHLFFTWSTTFCSVIGTFTRRKTEEETRIFQTPCRPLILREWLCKRNIPSHGGNKNWSYPDTGRESQPLSGFSKKMKASSFHAGSYLPKHSNRNETLFSFLFCNLLHLTKGFSLTREVSLFSFGFRWIISSRCSVRAFHLIFKRQRTRAW